MPTEMIQNATMLIYIHIWDLILHSIQLSEKIEGKKPMTHILEIQPLNDTQFTSPPEIERSKRALIEPISPE